jgi:hypothetical protein
MSLRATSHASASCGRLTLSCWRQNPRLQRRQVDTSSHAIFNEIPRLWCAVIASSYADSEFFLSGFMNLALAVNLDRRARSGSKKGVPNFRAEKEGAVPSADRLATRR